MFGEGPGEGPGCRCFECCDATTRYERQRQRDRRHGIKAFVSAREAAKHLGFLSTNGVGSRAVSDATGLSRSAVTKIATGKVTRIRPRTEERILGVHLGYRQPGALVDAMVTLSQIEELCANGWTRAAIARVVISPTARSLQIRGPWILQRTADAVAELYDSAVVYDPAAARVAAVRVAALRNRSI